MRRPLLLAWLALLVASPSLAQPLADHHQHLFSPALAALIKETPITSADLIGHLDAAGIKRAAVLSTAYIFSQPSRKIENDYELVKADNDWTAVQVARYPDRLIGFCGLNPLEDYALDELARCAKNPSLRHGLKLHFGNSSVDYHNADHLERLKRVLRAANGFGMAVVVHMRVNTNEKLAYGRDEALVFLNELLPAAPDVPVQVGHLAGAGGYEPLVFEQVLGVFADAIATGDPRTKNLWFDVTAVAGARTTPERAARIVERIRQLGVQRVLYGSDAPTPTNLPRDRWAAFRSLPLTGAELDAITRNVPPYMK